LALSVSSLGVPVEIDFDNYQGTGFQPGGGAGSLDSDVVRASLSVDDADYNPILSSSLPYGGTIGTGEFGRGVSSTLPSEFGLFALDLGGGNHALAGRSYEGGANESFGAYIEVGVLNDTGKTLNQLHVEYDLLYLNSVDSSIYADGHIGSYDVVSDPFWFETPENADSFPTWTVIHMSDTFQLPFPSWNADFVEPVAPGEYFFVGLSVGGSPAPDGLYDSVAWDNIRITALPEPNSLKIAMLMICVFTYGQRQTRKTL
jgi:hypothetical protein